MAAVREEEPSPLPPADTSASSAHAEEAAPPAEESAAAVSYTDSASAAVGVPMVEERTVNVAVTMTVRIPLEKVLPHMALTDHHTLSADLGEVGAAEFLHLFRST